MRKMSVEKTVGPIIHVQQHVVYWENKPKGEGALMMLTRYMYTH